MILSIIFALILCELLIVGWIDFKTEKISNRWILVNFIGSIFLHTFVQNLYPLSWEVLIFPLGLIAIGFFLFLINVMGAGDSKYLASLFLIIPLEYQMLFFEKLVVSTIITGSILLLFKVFTQREKIRAYVLSRYWIGIKDAIKSRFSYAPVVTVAWILLGLKLWK
jgi:prepilin peptidase CpaA